MNTASGITVATFRLAEGAANALLRRGARIISVTKGKSAAPPWGNEYEVWFEHERASDPEWQEEVLVELDASGRGAEVPVRRGALGDRVEEGVPVPDVRGGVHGELPGEARAEPDPTCARCGQVIQEPPTDHEGDTYHLQCLREHLRVRLLRRHPELRRGGQG